jgi:hypothetical protein
MQRSTFLSICLFIIIAGLSSCRTEGMKLISQFDGAWNLAYISLLETTADSVVLPESGTITFESCKIGKNNVNFCAGDHRFNGDVLQPFEYQPNGSTDAGLIAINILSRPKTDTKFYIQGHYKVTDINKDNLSLEGNMHIRDNIGAYNSHNVSMHFKR